LFYRLLLQKPNLLPQLRLHRLIQRRDDLVKIAADTATSFLEDGASGVFGGGSDDFKQKETRILQEFGFLRLQETDF